MNDPAPCDAEFAARLEVLRPRLMKHAFWLCRDRTAAESAVQEALLRAWRSRGQLRDPASLERWLIVICRRELARSYERKRIPTVCLDELPPEAEPVVDDGDAAELADIRRAVLELDDMYRLPLVMQVVEGLSTGEIAVRLGLQRQTVLTRLFRARRLLRTRLQQCGPGSQGSRGLRRAGPSRESGEIRSSSRQGRGRARARS